MSIKHNNIANKEVIIIIIDSTQSSSDPPACWECNHQLQQISRDLSQWAARRSEQRVEMFKHVLVLRKLKHNSSYSCLTLQASSMKGFSLLWKKIKDPEFCCKAFIFLWGWQIEARGHLSWRTEFYKQLYNCSHPGLCITLPHRGCYSCIFGQTMKFYNKKAESIEHRLLMRQFLTRF